MRVLVVLVLTLFVGCNVKPSHADQPTPKLDELNRTIREIHGSIFRIVDRSLGYILTKTEPGRRWSALKEEFFMSVRDSLVSSWEQLSQESKESVEAVIRGTVSIIDRVIDETEKFKREIKPIFDGPALVAEGIANEYTNEIELLKNVATPYFASLELHVREYLASLESSATPQQ